MHLHTGLWSELPPNFQDFARSNIPSFLQFLAEPFTNLLTSAWGIDAQLLFSGINHGVLFAVYAPDTVGRTTNEFVDKQIRHKPRRFHGLASLPVDNWVTNENEALNALQSALEDSDNMIGIKLAHPHMKINLTDTAYYTIYNVAETTGVPVYVHMGTAVSDESLQNEEATHPAFFENAIQQYPNVRFILGHMGNGAIYDNLEDPIDACIRLATTYSNVYLEASGTGFR